MLAFALCKPFANAPAAANAQAAVCRHCRRRPLQSRPTKAGAGCDWRPPLCALLAPFQPANATAAAAVTQAATKLSAAKARHRRKAKRRQPARGQNKATGSLASTGRRHSSRGSSPLAGPLVSLVQHQRRRRRPQQWHPKCVAPTRDLGSSKLMLVDIFNDQKRPRNLSIELKHTRPIRTRCGPSDKIT